TRSGYLGRLRDLRARVRRCLSDQVVVRDPNQELPMASPKIAFMCVRPFQVSHLCFEAGGIIGELNIELGSTVTPFDFGAFYTTLGSAPTVAGDASRLLYDPAAIQAFVGQSTLATLRAETVKAALINAINARQNSYFAKYANAAKIVDRTTND